MNREKNFLLQDEYWFENLNLRGSYKEDILDYIKENYNEVYPKYIEIYVRRIMNIGKYWQTKLIVIVRQII